MKRALKQLIFAVTFLTVIPGPKKLAIEPEDTGKSTAFFPLVGLLLGYLSSLVVEVPGLSAFAASIFITVFLILFTRGLHADGLIDTFDGFLSGKKSPEEIFKIMKESSIGALGFISAFSLYLVKIALLYEIITGNGINYRYYIIITPALSRSGVSFTGFLFKYPENKEGLGKSFIDSIGVVQFIIALLITSIFLVEKDFLANLILIPAVLTFWLIWNLICNKKIGGVTGDTIGAGIEITEILTLALVLITRGFNL